MKKLMFLCALVFISTLTHGQNGKISSEERLLIKNSMTLATSQLVETLSKLSEDEWTRRPADGGWTVAECMEHIVMAMPRQLTQLEQTLAQPADNANDLKGNDAFVWMKILDRGVKFKTPLPPKSGNLSKAELLKTYEETASRFLKMLDDKGAQWRNHFGQTPFGQADGYQLMILVPGHILRHHSQILEVLNDIRT
ncbi:MAG: DinB family protein [Cyclobacteriaceae bacterium]